MIDWTKPIETSSGEPAKLVYTSDLAEPNRYLVVWHDCGVMQSNWCNEYGDGFPNIRNVPEPPVKIEGFCGIDLSYPHGPEIVRITHGYPTKDRLQYGDIILNLATVSEKCPEAFEKVNP